MMLFPFMASSAKRPGGSSFKRYVRRNSAIRAISRSQLFLVFIWIEKDRRDLRVADNGRSDAESTRSENSRSSGGNL
jgi:hypothetical protein